MRIGKFVFILMYNLLGLSLVFSVSSAAEWTKEPTTFLGLKLDELLIGQIPECPASTMCFKMSKSGNDTAYFENLPYLGIEKSEHRVRVGEEVGNVDPGLSATANLTPDGKIYKITIRVGRSNNSQLIALAHSKYGRPQEKERVERNIFEQITPVKKRLYTNVGQKEYWYGDKMNIELLYTVDSVPDCMDNSNIKFFPGLMGVQMCESSQAAELTAESTSHIKSNELKEQEEKNRAIGNL